MKTIPVGIIGCGLMGREFASAISRWHHLTDSPARPQLIAICDPFRGNKAAWYTENFPSIEQVTTDYREIVANPRIEAVYCAVPHNLHQEFYCAVIDAGKHLMGEKPFGIDKAANAAILAACSRRPEVIARCSSQFPFYPAVQRMGEMIQSRQFGQIIGVNSGFLHSSDLDLNKPINWKRRVETNGEYGSMGDLGMHVCHVPLRAGWKPMSVSAVLSNIVTERPDGNGARVPCSTWDNATLLCRTLDPATGSVFPWELKTYRIAPGEKNTWYLEILGTRASAKFSTKNPKLLQILECADGEQQWKQIDMGYQTAFATITGQIFEFGFGDSILQMWAAFIFELVNRSPLKPFAGCATPAETAVTHDMFTAALESEKLGQTISLQSKEVAPDYVAVKN